MRWRTFGCLVGTVAMAIGSSAYAVELPAVPVVAPPLPVPVPAVPVLPAAPAPVVQAPAPPPSVPAPAPASAPAAPSAPATGSSTRSSGGSGAAVMGSRTTAAAPPSLGSTAAGAGPSAGQGAAGPASSRKVRRARAREAARRERHLRNVVEDLKGCLGSLPDLQRRVLVLRAGIGDARPRTRAGVARRLDLTSRHVRILERHGVKRLRASRRNGTCGASGSSTSSAVAPGAPTFAVAGTGTGGETVLAGSAGGSGGADASGSGDASPSGDPSGNGENGKAGDRGGVKGAAAEKSPPQAVALPPEGRDGRLFIAVTGALILLLLVREIQRGTLLRRRIRPYDDR